MKGFKAYRLDTVSGSVPASRRNYYTIYLLSDQRQLQRANRETEPDNTYLLLATPSAAASSAWLPLNPAGYACLFTEAFVQAWGLAGGQEP